MADVVLSATNTKPTSSMPARRPGLSGEALAIGSVAIKKTDNLWWKGNANTALGAGENGKVGVVTAGAGAAGQDVLIATEGDLTTSGLTAGVTYYMSGATAGALAPEADIATGDDYVVRIGTATSATNLLLDFAVMGVAA